MLLGLSKCLLLAAVLVGAATADNDPGSTVSPPGHPEYTCTKFWFNQTLVRRVVPIPPCACHATRAIRPTRYTKIEREGEPLDTLRHS